MPTFDPRGRILPPRTFASADHEIAFWRDGFVIADLLPPDALARILDTYADLRPADAFAPAPEHTSRYHCTFLDENLSYRREVDRLARVALDPLLPDILPGYEILTTNLYVKPPGTGRFEVHLNWITVVEPTDTTLTIWMPLQPTDIENGTIQVVPGSHKLYPDVASAVATQYFASFHQELIDEHLTPIPLQPGQAIIFDDTLIHWSSDNLSSEPRAAIQVELVPQDATTALWILDPDDPRWFRLYAMDSEFWLSQGKEAFYGTPDLPCIGRRPNPNRSVSYEEFRDRLLRSDEVRRASYAIPTA